MISSSGSLSRYVHVQLSLFQLVRNPSSTMCGRTAQTVGAVMAASSSLSSNSYCRGNLVDNIGPRVKPKGDATEGHDSSSTSNNKETESVAPEVGGAFPWHDNFNMSPGHDAVVFTMDSDGQLKMDRKIWGLVSKGGTSSAPLPEGPSKHFANLMFNARSDTLFSKPTFAKLLNERKTCLVAFDGFFEWKTDPLGGGKGKKQPYFVFRNNQKREHESKNQRPYLLMAGLWTSVPTGYAPPRPDTLDTFTILTTEVCDPLKWLHSRMPVCVWDEDLALKWLREPSQQVHEQIDKDAHHTQECILQWHAVSTQMSSTKYRSPDSIKALPKPKSVKSFFAPVDKKKGTATTEQRQAPHNTNKGRNGTKSGSSMASPRAKRPAPSSPEKKPAFNSKKAKRPTPDAKQRKGSITSFFAPKQSMS